MSNQTPSSLFIPDNYAELFPEARKMTRHFLIHVGGTNSGKTWKAVNDLESAPSGVYFGPLRLLAYEQYERMNHDQCPCSLITGEEQIIISKSLHQASTIEMFDAYVPWDVAVIDEAQMIADASRGGAWTNAILGLQAKRIHLCCSEFALSRLIQMIQDCGDTYEVEHCERKTPLVVERTPFSSLNDVRPHDALVAFSRRSVLGIASELSDHGIPSSVVYGALPYSVRHKEAERFSSGETQVVVATDAIGTGLNLPIERIVFMEESKFDGVRRRDLLPQEIQQIAGRAGRYGVYPVGYVNSLGSPEWIQQQLETEVPPLQKAVIGFPEILLDSPKPLSKILRQWQNSKAHQGYKKSNFILSIQKCHMMEQYTKDKHLMYQFLMIPFNEKSPQLFDMWSDLFFQMIQGTPVQSLSALFPLDELYILNELDLSELELLYQMCDLLVFYFHRFQLPYDSNQVNSIRIQISSAINQILSQQSYSGKVCRVCGKPLPWNYPYGLCRSCYEQQWLDEEEWL